MSKNNQHIKSQISNLQELLPEFTVRELPATTLYALGEIPVAPKVAVILPTDKASFRHGLLDELNKRTGISWHSDSRAIPGACARLDEISGINLSKLEGLTLAHLESTVTPEQREKTLAFDKAGPAFVKNLINRAEDHARKDGWQPGK